jgi:flagellar biosynthetic protein FliO
MNGLIAVTVVLAVLAGCVWLVRTGRFGRFSARASAVAVETAISLGERRSLVIVAVEGRRLLLGVTGTQVSLVTELQAHQPEAPRS